MVCYCGIASFLSFGRCPRTFFVAVAQPGDAGRLGQDCLGRVGWCTITFTTVQMYCMRPSTRGHLVQTPRRKHLLFLFASLPRALSTAPAPAGRVFWRSGGQNSEPLRLCAITRKSSAIDDNHHSLTRRLSGRRAHPADTCQRGQTGLIWSMV